MYNLYAKFESTFMYEQTRPSACCHSASFLIPQSPNVPTMLADLARPLTLVTRIFGLALFIAVSSNFRALYSRTVNDNKHDIMVQKMLSSSQRKAKANLEQVLAERKRRRQEAGVAE